jgi:hypothetical protein
MKHTKSLLLLASSLSLVVLSRAEDSSATSARWALSADAGTLGYGATVTYTFSPSLTFSAGYNAFSYSTSDVDVNGTGTYDAELKLSNVPVLLHWHPFQGVFNVFAGGSISSNKVDVVGQVKNGTYEIGDQIYTASQIGTLNGHVDISDGFTPIVGIGWSKTATKSGWGGYFQLGALFGKSPKATLSASGPIKDDPTFKAELAKEEKDLNDEIDSYKIYPLVRAGLMYRF